MERKSRFTISPDRYYPSEAFDYCTSLSENATLVAIQDPITDSCVFNALIADDKYPGKGLLGGKSVEGNPYQWYTGDLINATYNNWKAWSINPPNEECMIGIANGDTSDDYGWYSVDCSIPQPVICRDCASGYYFQISCWKLCQDIGDYAYWEVTCENPEDFLVTTTEVSSLKGATTEPATREPTTPEPTTPEPTTPEPTTPEPTTPEPTTSEPTTAVTTLEPTTMGPVPGQNWYCKFLLADNTCLRFDQNYNITKNGTINFSYSNIIETNQYSFNGVDRFDFKYLDLSHNSIIALHPNTLLDFTDIERINLNSNNLDYFPSRLFKTQYKLEKLSLGNNFLSSLPREAFDNTKIKFLDLSYNNFTSLAAEIFNNLTYVDTILLNHNLLESLGLVDTMFSANSRKYLKTYDLGHNLIYRLQDKQFDGLYALQELNLRGNQITEISTNTFYFASNTYIRTLDLGNNLIDTIYNSAWNYIRADKFELLDLSNNLIPSISKYQLNYRNSGGTGSPLNTHRTYDSCKWSLSSDKLALYE